MKNSGIGGLIADSTFRGGGIYLARKGNENFYENFRESTSSSLGSEVSQWDIFLIVSVKMLECREGGRMSELHLFFLKY